jgi:hypothetical protein
MSKVSELYERYRHIFFDTLKSLPEYPKVYMSPQCKACKKGKPTKLLAKNYQKMAPENPN